MSAGPSSTSKRSGSKPKGASRAKSGCYTCRIRRKKCDERPDAEGSCQTCVRLRLQCLGFGAKRPDWMREGNSVAEMREKIKTFLASNGMIKGHSASASLHPTTQTLSPPAAAMSLSTAVVSTSTPPRPLRDASGHDTTGLGTPLSATSTLTPEGRSASPPSPSSSHDSPGSHANNRPFPPGYIETPTRTRYDHTMSGSASGMHQEQPPSSASGVLHLSNGRPIGPPRVHSHVPTSRHLRRPHGSGVNGTNSEYGLGLGLVDDSLDQLSNSGNGAASNNSNTRCGPLSTYPITSRSTTVPACLPASSVSDFSVPSRFPSATSSHGISHSIYFNPRTRLAMNSTSNTPNMSSPTSGSASSASSSPAMRSDNTSFTPYTPLPPLPSLPPADHKSSVDMDWASAFVSSPTALPPTAVDTFSPHSDTDFGFDLGMHSTSGRPSNLTDMDGSNNGTHLDASNVRVKIEPDIVGLDFNNDYTADGSSVPTYNSYDNVSLRPRSSTGDDCATPVPNAFNKPPPAFANYNFSVGSSVYNNNNNDNTYWTGPSPIIPTPTYGFAASTPMSAREHAMYPVHAATGNSQYRHEPELSPDSPTPRHRDDPMMGVYASAPHVGGQGHGADSGYVNISHPPPVPYSLPAAHMRHGGSVQGGLNTTGQGYGPSHGYGHMQPTSSWTGDDNVRPTNYQQSQSQFLQQQQSTQAQVQPQALDGWTHNHSNNSATLQFPNASPTVRRTDLPPPSIQSSFGPLYTVPVDGFATDEIDAFAVQQAPLNILPINGVDEGALMPYGTHVSASINGMDVFGVSQEQQEQNYQYILSRFIPPAPMDPQYIGRGDGPLVEHYLRYVRPMQYFFLDKRVVELLRILALSNEAVRNSICSVASVHKRRMREGSVTLRGSSPVHAPLVITDGTPDAPEGDDDNTYYNRLRLALKTDSLTKAEAMAGLQCISSFLFAGGVGRWDFFLDVACRWVENVVGRYRMAGDLNLLGALREMKHQDELESFIVRATMWFEMLASVSMVRAPKFLGVYRILFGATDSARIVEIDGEAAHPPEAEFSMLEVMGCDNLTFLALAEISALAAWKEEEEQKQTLSIVELVKRGFAIEQRCLRAIADTRTNWRQDGLAPEEDSLENRRRLTADIFRASARLYLQTVLSGDKPSVREIREGVLETIEALNRVPLEPSLRRSVVRSVVFPICLAGCMTDDESERATILQFLQSEGGAGNCGSVVAVMETVWERRDAKQRRGKGGRRTAEHMADVSWREVLRERGGGVPILLV